MLEKDDKSTAPNSNEDIYGVFCIGIATCKYHPIHTALHHTFHLHLYNLPIGSHYWARFIGKLPWNSISTKWMSLSVVVCDLCWYISLINQKIFIIHFPYHFLFSILIQSLSNTRTGEMSRLTWLASIRAGVKAISNPKGTNVIILPVINNFKGNKNTRVLFTSVKSHICHLQDVPWGIAQPLLSIQNNGKSYISSYWRSAYLMVMVW